MKKKLFLFVFVPFWVNAQPGNPGFEFEKLVDFILPDQSAADVLIRHDGYTLLAQYDTATRRTGNDFLDCPKSITFLLEVGYPSRNADYPGRLAGSPVLSGRCRTVGHSERIIQPVATSRTPSFCTGQGYNPALCSAG
jgi:hypothetical protein